MLALRGLGSGFEAGEDGENDVTQGVKGKPERTQQVVGRQDAPGGQAVGLPEPLRRGKQQMQHITHFLGPAPHNQ